jgi:hypothetical protein
MYHNKNNHKNFDEIMYERFQHHALSSGEFIRDPHLSEYRSGSESNDTFQRALLLYEGCMRQSLHTEKQAKLCHFKTCSVTMDGCSG